MVCYYEVNHPKTNQMMHSSSNVWVEVLLAICDLHRNTPIQTVSKGLTDTKNYSTALVILFYIVWHMFIIYNTAACTVADVMFWNPWKWYNGSHKWRTAKLRVKPCVCVETLALDQWTCATKLQIHPRHIEADSDRKASGMQNPTTADKKWGSAPTMLLACEVSHSPLLVPFPLDSGPFYSQISYCCVTE